MVVGTTGMLSRELFEYRVAKGQGHEKDFLTVGSMGHASAIALGIAQFRPKRQVFAISVLDDSRPLTLYSIIVLVIGLLKWSPILSTSNHINNIILHSDCLVPCMFI